LYSFKRVPGYPLVVIVGLGYDEGLTLWRTNAKVILTLAAIATLLLGGLALLLTREISRRAMRDIAIVNESNKLQAANTELTEERRKLQIANIDLTKERSKLQVSNAELKESQNDAEVANHAKSFFLANMSHEFRTPLNAIIGFSQVIKDEIMGPGRPIYAEYAKDIWGAGEHLLEIINNVLDISKIEAGKTELSDELVDPAEIVGASIATMRVQAANKKIALTADISPGTPFIRGDALRLRQVLINLVSNAVKFTEAGHVTVSVAFDAVQGFRFTVADTGIGMSPVEIKKALEPFGQVENAITKKYEGTGLGLPLAQRLVELHGGRLEIESVKEVGTTVSVYLPLDRVVRSVPEVAA
jgi:signal transduction histidine kinase